MSIYNPSWTKSPSFGRAWKALSFGALLAGAFPAHAADRFWLPTSGSADWNDTANWSTTAGGTPGASVPGVSDIARFNGGGTVTINVNSAAVVDRLTGGATAGTYTFVGNPITIDGNGFPDTITTAVAGINFNFNSGINLNVPNAPQSAIGIADSQSGIFTVSGNITGANGGSNTFSLGGTSSTGSVVSGTIQNGGGGNVFSLWKTGGSIWRVEGNSTYTGGTTISGGTLQTGHANALGTGPVKISYQNAGQAKTLDLNSSNLTVDSLTTGIASSGNNVTTLAVASGGSGYTAGTTTVQITGGGGSGATAVATVSGGAVTAITITNFGQNYTSAPTITVNSPTGSGAVVTVPAFGASSVTLGSGTLTLSGANGGAWTYSGVISGVGGSLVKNGSSTQTLAGANTYTGATIINAGTLLLSSTGSIASTQIGFGVTDSFAGLLTVENTGFSFAGALTLDLSAVTANSASWTLFDGSAFGAGDLNLSSITSNLAGLDFTTGGGGIWSGVDGIGRTWTFNEDFGQLAVIPEPSATALLGASLMVMMVFRRRRASRLS